MRNLETVYLDREICWRAVLQRDGRFNGKFFYAVKSTGVFCRPTCPSRRPRVENIQFFKNVLEAEAAGYRACLRCKPLLSLEPGARRVIELCRYIEAHLDEPLTLQSLSNQAHLSPFHLQKSFKATIGLTPRQYIDARRLKSFKGNLRKGEAVTTAMLDAGYSSSSRLYERANAQLGMTPQAYRQGGKGTHIWYTITGSPLGRMLVAGTEKGVCSIQFGNDTGDLRRMLQEEYPNAELEFSSDHVTTWVDALQKHLAGKQPQLDLPLDIRATVFQRKVWEHLRSIPYGAIRTYSEVATALGNPSAVRAVAHACATNPVAIAVPCHRVIRTDGSLAGYRWGLERKEALLKKEKTIKKKKKKKTANAVTRVS